MMRKPKMYVALLFLFVFVFSMAFTMAGSTVAGEGPAGCRAVQCPDGSWNYGHEYVTFYGVTCQCEEDNLGCYHFCANCAM